MPVYTMNDPADRERGIAHAARALRSGRLVVFATESTYVLACDPFDEGAVRRYRTARNLDDDAPLPILVGSWSTIDGLMVSPSDGVRRLVQAFWPGSVSVVVEHAPSLSWHIGRTGGTAVIRMPLHPVAIEVLREVGPLAASVAPSGDPTDERRRQSPDMPAISMRLGEQVDVYLDSGLLGATISSTIIDTRPDPMEVLRAGEISTADLEQATGRPFRVAQ